MADNLMFSVNEGFNIDLFANQLAECYQAKGYKVNVANIKGKNPSAILTFDKGTGGINTVLGLGEEIKATCTLLNGNLNISYSDAEWTGKIIGLAAGWFLCFVPLITAIIGVTKQLKLPKSINEDATMIASGM